MPTCTLKRSSLLFPILLVAGFCLAQDSTTRKITISGFAELYWGKDFSPNPQKTRPAFLYSHTKQQSLALNLAFLKASYQSPGFRSAVALAAGTYMKANYASEPGILKNILEASAGVKISRKKQLWLDAGIFPSHIGFESAVSKDCRTVTRSLMAENSPYFETGLKLNFTSDNNTLSITLLALNGWQRISWPSNNKRIHGGLQVQYKPRPELLLNYSNFIGSLYPPREKRKRIFHNLYAQYSPSEHWSFTAGLDIGSEDSSVTSKGAAIWYSPALLASFTPHKKLSFTARGEYYSDKKGIVIPTGTLNGFQTFGYSVNVDYSLAKFLLLRGEFRKFISKDAIFMNSIPARSGYPFVTFSLAAYF